MTEFANDLDPSGVMYGPFANAADNKAHQSAEGAVFADEDAIDELCSNCHAVIVDANRDGILDANGGDLTLQNTPVDFEEYEDEGGDDTCVTCHMPVKQGVSKAAEGDLEASAPARIVHDHSFAGADYPFDNLEAIRETRGIRQELMRNAASIEIQNVAFDGANLAFDVEITNTNTGHNFPTGFAFARQAWLEVTVLGDDNQRLFESGFLERNTDDLCDAATIASPLGLFVRGCEDGQEDDLGSLQLQLVDNQDNETTVQFIDGAVLPRVRPIDGQLPGPITPNDSFTFGYVAPIGNNNAVVEVSVRLRFRNLPPYLLRAWDNAQGGNEVKLGTVLDNIEILEVDEANQNVNLQ